MEFYDGQIDPELFVKETLSVTANRYLRLKKSFIILGVLNLFLLVIVLIASYVDMKGVEDKIKTNIADELNSAKLVMSMNIKGALNDLFFLSDVIDQEYNILTEKRKPVVVKTLYNFIKNSDSYDQARILSTDGMEVIRINKAGNNVAYVVPDEKLQDKSDRDYFKESMALATSVAYISKLDLNIENKVIQVPYNLTLRIATPIFSKGIIEGALVLNFLGSTLLADAVHILKQGKTVSGDKYFLMNSKGHPLAYIEWADQKIRSSMLGYDAAYAFHETFNRPNEEIFMQPDGTYSSGNIIFSKTTIRVDSTASKSNRQYDLIKVNVLPHDDLDESDLVLISTTSNISYISTMLKFIQRNKIPFFWIEAVFIFIASLYSGNLVKEIILENAIKAAAAYDPLTTVYNRRFGILFLKHEMKKIDRAGGVVTLFVIDVNNLKKVNDTCGHGSGDKLLRLVAERLKKEIREYDIVCRIGGDEFIVAFSGTGLQNASGIIERVRLGLEKEYNEEFKEIGVDFSYGGVEYNKYKYNTFEEFLHEADERMYKDKKRRKQGRG